VGATKGLESAAIAWDDGPNSKVSNPDIVKQLEEESKKPGVVAQAMAMQGRLLPWTPKLATNYPRRKIGAN
jgi:isoquinoline 1-oxidoreductase beta subunit